jgi:hypothetical protein
MAQNQTIGIPFFNLTASWNNRDSLYDTINRLIYPQQKEQKVNHYYYDQLVDDILNTFRAYWADASEEIRNEVLNMDEGIMKGKQCGDLEQYFICDDGRHAYSKAVKLFIREKRAEKYKWTTLIYGGVIALTVLAILYQF